MQRLKLEGTPRVKRTKRQAAPPLSPIAATTDYTDFGLPSISASQDPDLNYGSLAQSMLNNMFSAAGLPASSDPLEEDSPIMPMSASSEGGLRGSSPTSPSPLTGDVYSLGRSPSKYTMERVDEEEDLQVRPLLYGDSGVKSHTEHVGLEDEATHHGDHASLLDRMRFGDNEDSRSLSEMKEEQMDEDDSDGEETEEG